MLRHLSVPPTHANTGFLARFSRNRWRLGYTWSLVRPLIVQLRIASVWVSALTTLGVQAGTVVFDPFTDGSRFNTNGGDPQGLVYFQGQTSSRLVVTNDAGGL